MNYINSRKIFICLSLYITSLFAANTLGVKLMPFLLDTHLSVAIFSYPIIFIMTDVIGEVYGKKMAKSFVLAGVISVALFLLYSILSSVMPWSGDGLWVKDGYNQIFGLSTRFSVASLVAFVVAEYQDVFSFFFFKNRLGDKHFWLRSNLSNVWSQFLDSGIFMIIAYMGILPFETIVLIIIPWWIYKIFMGFLYTPLSYLAIYLLKDRNYENKTNKN